MSETRRFTIGGAAMSVVLAGDRERPALLLIHGFPASSASFRDIVSELARDLFVIAPDLPGFGDSDPVDGPSFAGFAAALAAAGAVFFALSAAVFCATSFIALAAISWNCW